MRDGMQQGYEVRDNPDLALDRRKLLQLGGGTAALSLAGCASAATAGGTPSAAAAPISVDASTPQRKWAHKHLTGLLNLTLPSFQQDLKTLDEDGLRHDIRHAVAQGFSGTLPLINWTPTGTPEWEQYHRILLDEARGKIPVHGVIASSDPETDIAALKKFEAMGVEMVLLASRFDPKSTKDELLAAFRKRIEATELPIMLYAALNKGRNFPHLGPAGQPLEIFDRLADMPNVTAVKISQPVTLTSTRQICDVVGDRLLVGPVNLDFAPMLARHYHIQWSGQWNAEAVQTPDRQIGNQLLHACAAKDFERADQLAMEIQPVLDHFFQLQAEVIRKGAHPWQHNKFYAWLGGGNGGLLPDDAHATPGSIPTLTAADRDAIRKVFSASGLTMTEAPEDQFVTGRTNWARGVRPADLAALPHYAGA